MNCLPSFPRAEGCIASKPVQQGWVNSVPWVFICTFCYYMIFKLLLSVILFYSTYYFNAGLGNTFCFFTFLTCWMSVNQFIYQLSLRSAKVAGLWLSMTLVASLKVALLQRYISVICTCCFFVLLHFYLWFCCICSFSVMLWSHCGVGSCCPAASPQVQHTSLTVANVKVSFKAHFYHFLFDWLKCA